MNDAVSFLPQKARQDLLVFPNITPSKITQSAFHIIEANDITDEQGLQHLLWLMFDCPERAFYYFHEKDIPVDMWIGKARNEGQLLLNETEFFYYRHPRFRHDYVKITPRDTYSFEWESEVEEKGPMYLRTKLELTSRMQRQMEVQQKIMIEQKISANPLELKPNFMGIGVDVFRLWSWIKNKLRKTRT